MRYEQNFGIDDLGNRRKILPNDNTLESFALFREQVPHRRLGNERRRVFETSLRAQKCYNWYYVL